MPFWTVYPRNSYLLITLTSTRGKSFHFFTDCSTLCTGLTIFHDDNSMLINKTERNECSEHLTDACRGYGCVVLHTTPYVISAAIRWASWDTEVQCWPSSIALRIRVTETREATRGGHARYMLYLANTRCMKSKREQNSLHGTDLRITVEELD